MGTLRTYPHELILPRIFVEDHYYRGLDTGYNPRWLNDRQVFVRCTDAALAEIESDARHYSTEVDMAPKDIIASARRTVAAIKRYQMKREADQTSLAIVRAVAASRKAGSC